MKGGNELPFYEVAVVTASVVIAGICSLGTATHFSSFLSVSPSEAVVSSVSASAPVLVVLLAVARLVVELVAVLAPIMTGAKRGLSLASWRKESWLNISSVDVGWRETYEFSQFLTFLLLENKEVKQGKAQG